MKSYEKYRLKGKLISKQSGKIYDFRIDENDRFFSYIKPYLIDEKTSSTTKLMIDDLVVTDKDRTFLSDNSENRFKIEAVLIATDSQDMVYGFELVIDNIKFNTINVSKFSYENDNWKCSLFEMEMPAYTKINIVERN